LRLAADRGLHDVREHDFVDAADCGHAVHLTDRIEQLIRDRAFVIEGRIGHELAVERDVEEHAKRARVELAVIGLDAFAVVRIGVSAGGEDGAAEGSCGEDRGEALHVPGIEQGQCRTLRGLMPRDHDEVRRKRSSHPGCDRLPT
jgi:hypothetical protein